MTKAAIKVGDALPDVGFKAHGPDGLTDVSAADLFAGRTVALFCVPGAYTPTCTARHLPGYVEHADALRAAGADEIACISVNDPFVMAAWGRDGGADGAVRMLADWDAAWTRAVGLERDLSGAGLGARCARAAMIVRDGKLAWLAVEPDGGLKVSGAEQALSALKAL